MTTTENEQRGSITQYAALKDAAASLHYWQDARRQHAEALDKAALQVRHADERITDHSEKLRSALVGLGLAYVPEAGVGK